MGVLHHQSHITVEDATMLLGKATGFLESVAGHRVPSRLSAALAWLYQAYALYRQRRALLSLSDAMLKDLGLSRVDALREASKPCWRG